MKYNIAFTNQYLKDLQLARKRGLDESLLNEVLLKLCNGESLPKANKDHALKRRVQRLSGMSHSK